jgi:hypothetical protein
VSEQILADLGRKITRKLQDDLQREMRLAQHVLGSHDTTVLMMKIAAGVLGAAVMVAMQIRKPDTDPAEIFDTFADLIRMQAGELKPDYLKTLAEIEQQRASARGAA